MKVLMISTDAQIFNENSAVRERIKEYGSLAEELHVVVFTRQKFQISNLKSQISFKSQISNNVFVYATGVVFKPLSILAAYKIAKKIILNSKPHLLNSWVITPQDPFETAVVGIYLKKKLGIPLQIQIHTDFLSSYFWRQSFKNYIRRFCWGVRFLKKADGIRAVSERIKRSLESRIKNLESRIMVLPIFFDAMRFQNAVSNNQYPEDFLI